MTGCVAASHRSQARQSRIALRSFVSDGRGGTGAAGSRHGLRASSATAPTPPMKPVRIGCSGWMYDDWRGRLYPERLAKRRWLEGYASAFDTVEVNSTFYRLARREAVAGWVEQTPAGFLFAVKASRYLTHIKRLVDIARRDRALLRAARADAQAGRLGPVLWQLPENFHRDDRRARGLARSAAREVSNQHTIEFRHPSWFAPEVFEALRSHGVALTIGDHPERPFQTFEATAYWRFVRFHYGSRGRAGNYSAAEIDTWARRIAQWRRREQVFAYFNNDWRGFAPANAKALLAAAC